MYFLLRGIVSCAIFGKTIGLGKYLGENLVVESRKPIFGALTKLIPNIIVPLPVASRTHY
jgi:hypothetical protein